VNIVNALGLLFVKQQTWAFRLSLTLLSEITSQMNSIVLMKNLYFNRKYGKVLSVLKIYFFRSKLKFNFKLVVKQAAVNFENSYSKDMYSAPALSKQEHA